MRNLLPVVALLVLVSCGGSSAGPDACVLTQDTPLHNEEPYNVCSSSHISAKVAGPCVIYQYQEFSAGGIIVKPSEVSRMVVTINTNAPCPNDFSFSVQSPSGKTMALRNNDGGCIPGDFSQKVLIDHQELTDLVPATASGTWILNESNNGAPENFNVPVFPGANGYVGVSYEVLISGTLRMFSKCGK